MSMPLRVAGCLALGTLLLAAIACGGDGAAPAAQPQVKANDGSATLSVPTDALPKGVSLSDIKVTRVAAGSDQDEEAPVAVYELKPDGLKFDKPVDFSVSLPVPKYAQTQGVLFFVLVLTAEGVEIPDGQKITVDADSAVMTVSANLTHFSSVQIGSPPITVTLEDPNNHFVGESFNINGSAAFYTSGTNLANGGRILYEQIAPYEGSWTTILGPKFKSAGLLEPAEVTLDDFRVSFYADHPARFSCKDPGQTSITFEGTITWKVLVSEWRKISTDLFRSTEVTSTQRFSVKSRPFKCLAEVPPTATPPGVQLSNKAPSVTPIETIVEGRTTTYSILTEDPDTVTWSGPNCGEWAPKVVTVTAKGRAQINMAWTHPTPPCVHDSPDHMDVTVTAKISDKFHTIVCTYRGAAQGSGLPDSCREE
jgi:hypothetical protein